MKVEQIANFVNTATLEATGQNGIVAEDLSNIVDAGKTVSAVYGTNQFDNYVRSIVNQIGKMVFVSDEYRGNGLAELLYMDSWEWGSILEKLRTDIPEAKENETWKLTDGASYDSAIFYKPDVHVKFYNDRVTFEIAQSITEKQVKESFLGASQMRAFIAMVEMSVVNSMKIKTEELARRAINSAIADTVYSAYSGSVSVLSGKTSVRAVNLLYEYNQQFSTSLTATDALYTPAFARFAALRIGEYRDRMKEANALLNSDDVVRWTPEDRQRIIMHSDFYRASSVYLQSDTFHNDLVRYPDGIKTISYWQGTGTGYDLDDTTEVNVTSGNGNAVDIKSVIAVMFDKYAVGITNLDKRTTSHYSAAAEFTNYFHKEEMGLFTDSAEQFIVFYAA